MGSGGGRGRGSSLSDALTTRPHPHPASPHLASIADTERSSRQPTPPQSSLLLDDNRVSARGGDRAERYSQVPQVALSANLSQRSLGLLINPRPSSLPGSAPSLPASPSTLPGSESHPSSRVPSVVALRPLLSSRAPGRQETARRRSSRHTGTGGRARTMEAHVSVIRRSRERGRPGRTGLPHPPPLGINFGGRWRFLTAVRSRWYDRVGPAPSY